MNTPPIRAVPRISVTKLAEYLVTTPTRRRTIVLDAKFPPDVKVRRYRVAREATTAAICSGDLGVLDVGMHQLATRRPRSSWDAQDISTSLLALEQVREILRGAPFFGFEATRGANRLPSLIVENVRISVRPDVILSTPTGAGAVLLYFSKTGPLSPAVAEYAAVLLYQHMVEVTPGRVASKHCYVVDVFARTITSAPRAHRRRSAEVAAGCREIAMRWEAP